MFSPVCCSNEQVYDQQGKHLGSANPETGQMTKDPVPGRNIRKYMNIERAISWFDINTEELFGEINIDNISLETLKDIFKPGDKDPLMYNPYTINAREAEELKKIIDMEFDLDRFHYQVDCFQV